MILDAEKEIILRIKEIEKERQRREKGDNLSLYNTGKKIHKKQILWFFC